MSNRRRFFASNTEMNMSDHIRNVANLATRNVHRRQPCRAPISNEPISSVPVTLIDGVTSYISYTSDTPAEINQCQLNKIRLYPYGSFYPTVKYNANPGDCK